MQIKMDKRKFGCKEEEKEVRQESYSEDATTNNAVEKVKTLSTLGTRQINRRLLTCKINPKTGKKVYNLRYVKIDGQYKRLRKDGKLCLKVGTKKGQKKIRKDGKPWGKRKPKPRQSLDKFTCDICGKSGAILRAYRHLVWHKFKHHALPLSVSCNSHTFPQKLGSLCINYCPSLLFLTHMLPILPRIQTLNIAKK